MADALESSFAIVSVRGGREGLARRLYANERVPVVIRGFIVNPWSRDDGIDREFSVEVSSIEEGT